MNVLQSTERAFFVCSDRFPILDLLVFHQFSVVGRFILNKVQGSIESPIDFCGGILGGVLFAAVLGTAAGIAAGSAAGLVGAIVGGMALGIALGIAGGFEGGIALGIAGASAVTLAQGIAFATSAPGTVRPTEAEWEYAGRAGSTQNRYGDSDRIAWYNGNSRNQTHEVAQMGPNAWGLYDMLGDVWEWVADWYGNYDSGSLSDPQGPSGGERCTLRGCS
jgi:hypothetical protein